MFAYLRSSVPRNHAQPGSKIAALANAAPLPIVAMIAVAVTGPTPGIATSLRQASFSRAIFSIDLSARSIFSASCSSSCFSLRAIPALPLTAYKPPASIPGNASST